MRGVVRGRAHRVRYRARRHPAAAGGPRPDRGRARPSAFAPPPTTTAPALAATSDIPVGGGKIFPDYRLVVTRPSEADLKAFTAICTHDGCMLNSVTDKTINCPCHRSRFAITDGAVVHGPALRALTPRTITVEGDSIFLDS